MNKMENVEKAYSPKEISLTLDIGDSTLRKWCIALEKNGYGFIRNDQKTRVFVESDLVVLRHFQNLVKQHNMQLDNAAKLVVDRFGKGAFEVGTGIVPAENKEEQRALMRSNEDVMEDFLEHLRTQDEVNRELLSRLEKQDNFNRELISRLDQQQRYFEERMKQEQKDRELMESLKESMREQKQLQLEIAAAAQEEKKKGFWTRLLGK
jgi:hypothetical protein